jgi:hypothetical protein
MDLFEHQFLKSGNGEGFIQHLFYRGVFGESSLLQTGVDNYRQSRQGGEKDDEEQPGSETGEKAGHRVIPGSGQNYSFIDSGKKPRKSGREKIMSLS